MNGSPMNPRASWPPSTWRWLLALLTLFTLLIQGYHPFAEDGGMYLARVLTRLHPGLFAANAGFVREPLRISIFSPALAALVHLTHLPLPWILLSCDIAGIWLTLYAAHQLLRRCIRDETAQFAGVALLAAWSTMPVAATSLLLMDPYVTARTFSMPLSLLAIAFALDDWTTSAGARSGSSGLACTICLICLFLAAAFHPLMAAYAAGLILILLLLRRPHKLLAWTLPTAATLLLGAALQALAPPDPPAVVAADITRYYWFLSQWHWYELLGLAGPLAVLAALLRSTRVAFTPAARTLLRASILFGLIGLTIALLFAHESYRSHLVARFQPLRVFCLIYAIFPLLLGVALPQFFDRFASRRARSKLLLRSVPMAIVLTSACVMFFVQRSSFPASIHLEFPGRANPNPWVRAFVWIRANTPPDALFAADARYVNTAGEDAQNFRALTLRSMLPDYSKDGGEASQMPDLAAEWQRAATAQADLSSLTDATRDARLQPLGATWMLLHSSAVTMHPCPYDNGVVKVCRLAR